VPSRHCGAEPKLVCDPAARSFEGGPLGLEITGQQLPVAFPEFASNHYVLDV
jgi:hypothetical protein